MEVNHTIEDIFTVWNYKQLCVVGVQGKLSRSLAGLSLDLGKGVEIAPLVRESPKEYTAAFPKLPGLEEAVARSQPREFLALFQLSHPLDATIVRTEDSDASVVVYGLDKSSAKGVVQKILQQTGTVPCRPDENLTGHIDAEFRTVETKTYEMAETLARALRVSVEQVWGAVRYANFLYNYLGVKKGPLRIAARRFGLPEHLFP